jgi:hypothetical protein
MFHTDIATGEVNILGKEKSEYKSKGPESSFQIKNTLPEIEEGICYTYMPLSKCTAEQLASLANGTAVVKDWVVVG